MEAPGGLRKPFWRGMPPPTPQKRVGVAPFTKWPSSTLSGCPWRPRARGRAGRPWRGPWRRWRWWRGRGARPGSSSGRRRTGTRRPRCAQPQPQSNPPPPPPPPPPPRGGGSALPGHPHERIPGASLQHLRVRGLRKVPQVERSGARRARPHRASARPPRPARVTPPSLRGRRPAQGTGQWAGSSWGSPAPRAGSWWRTAARRSRAPRDPGRRPGRGVTAPGGPRRGASPTRTVGGAGAGLPCSLAPALSTPPSPAALPPASPAPREERETDRRAARRR